MATTLQSCSYLNPARCAPPPQVVNGSAALLVSMCESSFTPSSLQQVAVMHILQLTASPEHVQACGGLQHICKVGGG